MKNKVFTIMFTDIVGNSSTKSDNLDDFIEKQNNIIRDLCNKNKGIFVKKIGEGFMYIFNNPTIALISAVEIQKAINNINKTGFGIKIGINTGEVQYTNEYNFEKNRHLIDVFGTPVNIASRVKSLSKIGEIYFTNTTLLSTSNKNIAYTKVGFKKLKGINNKTLILKINLKKDIQINKNIYIDSITGTIMNTDIVGYTDKVSSQTRIELKNFIDNQKKIIEPIIAFNKGKIIKTIGDAYVVFFESPTNALLAAKQIQNKIKIYNSRVKDLKKVFKIRIGINTGEINIKDGEYFGVTCDIATKLESISKPGSIFFSEYTNININQKDIKSYSQGIKNIEGEKIKIYKLDLGEYNFFNSLNKIAKKSLLKIKDITIKLIIIILILSIIFGSIFLFLKSRNNNPIYISNGINSIEKYIDKELRTIKTKYIIFKIKYLK